MKKVPNVMPSVFGSRDKHAEMIDLIKKTHNIFQGIEGKGVSLITVDPPGRTDTETFVGVPLEDPQADLIHKHEWQHIFFKTDLRARAEFVKEYVHRLLLINLPSASEVSKSDLRAHLEEFIHHFCNGIDDLRVASLWHSIYPYSAELIEERWKNIILTSNRFRTDVIMYMMAKGLGLDTAEMRASQWARWDPLFVANTQLVKGQGFPAVLLAARNILDTIMIDLVRDMLPPPPAPGQQAGQQDAGQGPSQQQTRRLSKQIAGRRLLEQQPMPQPGPGPAEPPRNGPERRKWDFLNSMVAGARPTILDTRLADTTEPPKTMDPDRAKTQATVSAVLGSVDESQIHLLLGKAKMEMDAVIRKLRNQNAQLSGDQQLARGLEGKVHFKDVYPKDVELTELTEEDERLVQHMRRSFTRLMDKVNHRLSDSGSSLDPGAFIDLLLGNSDGDVFVEDVNTKGFSALLLIDMSGSMKPRWDYVARAAKVLAKSLRFPFSSFEVWGFTSGLEGQARIYRFKDTEKGYDGPTLGAWKLTPMQVAIQVAVRKARQMPGSVRHLIVITDGMPTDVGRRAGVFSSHQELVRQIGDDVKQARQAGINVAGLVIEDDVKDADATRMFGNKRFWSRTDEDNLFKSMTSLVEKAFVNYLRGRR